METASGPAPTLRWWEDRGMVKEMKKMLKKEEARLDIFSHNNTLLCRSLFAASLPLGLKLDIFHPLKVLNDFWKMGRKSDFGKSIFQE